MKKVGLFILIALLIIPSVLAFELEVTKKSSNEVMITEISNPAIFNLEIRNKGPSETIRFYNLLGFQMSPQGTITFGAGETKEVELKVYPREDLDVDGYFTFQYFIRNQLNEDQQERLTVKIIDLKDAFEVGSGELDPESNSLEIYISNKENFDFGEITVDFSSAFFATQETFVLGPNEKKEFTVKLDREDFKKLMAGFYTLTANIIVDGEKASVDGTIKFVEKDIVTTLKKESGIIISTSTIEKTNEGNVLTNSETVVKKNIISRLFTRFSPEPDIVEREGFTVYYTWNRGIKPGEKLEITITTNWLFPFLIILFIVIITIAVKKYSKTDLVLRKKVAYVKTRGGEFAMKVSLYVNARSYIEKINIIDKIPALVKVYDRFGSEKPRIVDEKNRRIEWNYEKLEAGEVRLISYIIYSKVGVLGKFALPETKAFFEKDGEIKEAESNKAFFVTEQSKEEIEE